MPLSSIHVVPVISPLPLSVNQAANTGSRARLAARMNDGDAGAHRALCRRRAALAGDQRRVADLDAGDVGDGVQRARLAPHQPAEPELARPLFPGRTGLRDDAIDCAEGDDQHQGSTTCTRRRADESAHDGLLVMAHSVIGAWGSGLGTRGWSELGGIPQQRPRQILRLSHRRSHGLSTTRPRR